MKQYERELSNLSYTNKDFGQIYPELLDLVKKLSYKWDPSVSDESDPGVVLLKLAALMADKNNYNIDKNILELFPLSVSQLQNARQIFEQCGYYMRYYQSATTDLQFTVVKEPRITEDDVAVLSPNDVSIDLDASSNTRTYVLPRFTMVSDVDNTVVYTTTAEALVRSNGVVSSAVPAIQGTINTYTINGESVITASNLDYNNRLYFTELDIPENGIFITGNTNQIWTRVDNLVLQPLGSCCYKFGLTESGSSCYIEFPSDIDSLIGNGITINYIRTMGLDGNIGRKRLTQFYNDVSATRYIDSFYPQEVVVTAEDIYITNLEPSVNGKNPETIDEAYRNYEKVKTTFETLVSLRDYENFLYTNKNVSNCFVCDRTNDVESSYKILNSGTSYTTTQIRQNMNGDPELDPFDLRVYGLRYVEDPTTTEGFNKSFSLIDQNADTASDWLEILQDTEMIKSIQHNYKNFETNRILMIVNRYPIVSRIIPQYKLETKQQEEVKKAIVTALYRVLNSRALDFGSPIEYDLVYDTIVNADPRIKAITLNDIDYQSFAVYKDDTGVIKELRIDNESNAPSGDLLNLWNQFRQEIYAKSVIAGRTQLLVPDDRFTFSLSQTESSLITDAYRLTTDAQIIATPSEEEPLVYISSQLKENENIVFQAPNMVKDQDYSSYVKFVHNIGLTTEGDRKPHEYDLQSSDTLIGANDEYTLKENEYIVFFWKTEDDEYAPYQYKKYSGTGKVKVISPSFRLMLQRNPDSLLLPPFGGSTAGERSLSQILKSLPSDTIGTTDTEKIGISGTLSNGASVHLSFTEYVAALMGSEYVLSGSTTITTKKENQIHITNKDNGTRYVYWVLNESSDGKCTLFDADETEYTLATGEYFIYSNSARTQLHLLGSGTKITRNQKSAIPWQCDVINYDEFIEGGVHYLDNCWFEVNEEYDIYAQEMQFYQLGPGNIVKLSIDKDAENKPASVVFDHTGVHFIDSSGTIVRSGEDILYSFTISYIDETGIETSLPMRNTVDTCWEAYSILNLKVSSSTLQHLDSNHTIWVYNDSGDEVATLNNETILTNRAVTLTGGIKLDATTLDLINNIAVPLQIFSYTNNSNYNQVMFDNYLTNVIIPAQTTHTETITFMLPVGTYILPLYVESTIDDLKISFMNEETLESTGDSSEPLYTISGSSVYNDIGAHYLKMEVVSQNSDALVATGKLIIESTSSDTVDTKLTFRSIYKYTTDIEDDYVESITSLIDNVLDTDHLFDYTYIVPEEDKISNPLDSQEFLDANHVFNSYTICKWDTDSMDNKLVVINKIK